MFNSRVRYSLGNNIYCRMQYQKIIDQTHKIRSKTTEQSGRGRNHCKISRKYLTRITQTSKKDFDKI